MIPRHAGKAPIASLAVLIIFLAATASVSGAEMPVQGLPSSITKFLSNERINVYAVGPDSAATVTGFVIGEEMKVDVKKGGISNPTVNIFMSNRLSEHLEESEEPLALIKDALASGEMKIQGVGMKSGIKVSGFLEALKRLAPEGRPVAPKEVSAGSAVTGSLEALSKKTAGGSYAIEKGEKLRHSSVEVDAGKETAGKTIAIKEYSGLKYSEIPLGTKNLPFSGKEEPLGTFIDVQLPEGAGQTTIKFYYTKDELYSKSIKEDELQIKWYDESTGSWIALKAGDQSWVKELIIDKENSLVLLRVTHASVYGIGGAVVAQVPEKITVKQPEPAVLEAPDQSQLPAQPQQVVEISTESPNWLAIIAGAVIIFLVLLIVFIIKRRGKKDKQEEKQEKK